jgi:hypothetical protein
MQPFPVAGDELHANLNLGLPVLRRRVGGVNSPTYSYVMTTVYAGLSVEPAPVLVSVQNNPRTCGRRQTSGSRPRRVDASREVPQFEQWGSAPNFQGDVMTLCTCKHQMRAAMDVDDWYDAWVAGFTTRNIHNGRNWLFYLARVQHPLPSQYELWNHLSTNAREAKSASNNRFGDAYVPVAGWDGKNPFTHTNYVPPTPDHVHQGIWRYDINNSYYGRRPALLVFDPDMSFLWERPRIYFDGHHPRTRGWDELPELFDELRAG